MFTKKEVPVFFVSENSNSELERLFVKFSRLYTIRNTYIRTQTPSRTPLNE